MSSLGPLPLLHPGGLAAKLEASYLKYRQDQPNRAAVARIARIEEEYHKYLKVSKKRIPAIPNHTLQSRTTPACTGEITRLPSLADANT